MRVFHQIWITSNRSSMKWAPGPHYLLISEIQSTLPYFLALVMFPYLWWRRGELGSQCATDQAVQTLQNLWSYVQGLPRTLWEISERKKNEFNPCHAVFIFGYLKICLHFFLRLRWLQWFKSFLIEDKDSFIVHIQHHECYVQATQGAGTSAAMVLT